MASRRSQMASTQMRPQHAHVALSIQVHAAWRQQVTGHPPSDVRSPRATRPATADFRVRNHRRRCLRAFRRRIACRVGHDIDDAGHARCRCRCSPARWKARRAASASLLAWSGGAETERTLGASRAAHMWHARGQGAHACLRLFFVGEYLCLIDLR
ncbi:hypothetical protein BC834DRAFT_691595 [Gloeopeniophorella convolvens]|nr:hypothetical protein BC834DRAFT_691595 [Gloeopeniophorella convolvens]